MRPRRCLREGRFAIRISSHMQDGLGVSISKQGLFFETTDLVGGSVALAMRAKHLGQEAFRKLVCVRDSYFRDGCKVFHRLLIVHPPTAGQCFSWEYKFLAEVLGDASGDTWSGPDEKIP